MTEVGQFWLFQSQKLPYRVEVMTFYEEPFVSILEDTTKVIFA